MWWGILTNQILEVSAGLREWSLWVSAGGLCGSLLVVSGSLQVVFVGLCGWSPQVVSMGLHKSPWVVSTGLCGWSPWVSGWSLHFEVSVGGLCG